MVVRSDYRRSPPKTTGFFSRWSVTSVIILINVVLFFLSWIVLAISPEFLNFLALQPSAALSGGNLWTILTSVFMHSGFFHLFVNMFSLFFLGSLTERIIGRKRFFWFYLIAGLLGGVFFVLFAFAGQFFPRGDFVFGGIDDSAVGASGAIFGLLGILAVLLPKKEIYLIVGPIVVIILQFLAGYLYPPVSGAADTIASILIFVMIFAMFSPHNGFRRIAMPLRLQFWIAPFVAIIPLLIIGFLVKLPIGNTAHLGGLVAGLIYGGYLRSKYTHKVKLLNRMIR